MNHSFQKFDPYSFLQLEQGPVAKLAKPAKAHVPQPDKNLATLATLAWANPQTPFDVEAYEERAAIIEANGVPREWAEGYATLCTMPRPVAYTPERWQEIVDDGGRFLDEWGREAALLGWQAVDVFGVDPNAPENRYDGMGLVVLLAGRRVSKLKKHAAAIDCGMAIVNTFYRRTISSHAISVWKLGGES